MWGLFSPSNSGVWMLSVLEILLFLFDLIVFCRLFFSLQLLGVAKEVGTQHHNRRRVTVNNYLRVLYNFASFKIRIHRLYTRLTHSESIDFLLGFESTIDAGGCLGKARVLSSKEGGRLR